MPTLTIRSVPDDIVADIKLRASENGRSMEAEVRQLLAEAARERRLRASIVRADRGFGARLHAIFSDEPFDDFAADRPPFVPRVTLDT